MIFAIETSCDETSCAVYDEQRHQLLSNIIFSQIDLHQYYGGVIPELASHAQLEKITSVAQEALSKAKKTLFDINTVAVTYKPGLPGSLLVGVAFAKALAWAQQKPIIGVNHLEGHVFSASIEHDIPFPYLCITASGGHTSLYIVHNFGDMQLIGQTIDDAAGEAFDKVAKLIGLAYPGGPIIEKLAREVHFQDFFHYPRSMPHSLDFSFSGLKTAVLYHLVEKNYYDLATKKLLPSCSYEIKQQVASSLLVCMKDIFIQKIALAIKHHPNIQAIALVGGVACNKYLKEHLANYAHAHQLSFFSPSPLLCTDNAGMIAFVAGYKMKQGKFSDQTLDVFDR